MLLYQIIHLESGFKYIGQTTRPFVKRWREHLYMLRKNRHPNRYLQSAWNKYGENSFKFEILKEFNTLEELNKAEIELIKTGSNLFNLADGGNAFKHDLSVKKAIGETNKKPIVGMNIRTGETKEYGSASEAAIDGFNPSSIRKCVLGYVSTRKDGTVFESISHKGWVWASKASATEDLLKSKCDIAKVSKVHNERPVIGMNVFTKDVLRFKSASEAGRNGFNGVTVYKSCNKFSSVHKGFVWVYGDMVNPQSLLESKVTYALSKVKRGPKSWA